MRQAACGLLSSQAWDPHPRFRRPHDALAAL